MFMRILLISFGGKHFSPGGASGDSKIGDTRSPLEGEVMVPHPVTLALFNRSALLSTNTLESPMAAAPSMGEKVTPKAG